MSATEGESNKSHRPITPVQEREMAMLLALAGIVVGYLTGDLRWFVGAGIVLVLGLIIPIMFKPLAWAWLTITRLIGLIVSRVVLSLIFFLIVTPIGLVRRWTGRDTMHVGRFKKEAGSAFRERDKEFGPDDLERPY